MLTEDGRAVEILWRARQSVDNVPWLPEGLLVNAGTLVDGAAIRFAQPGESPARFTYWHIETEAHEALLAEGVPAESFVDYLPRTAFDNHDDDLARHGADRTIPEMDRPRISARRLLPATLAARLKAPNLAAA